MRYEGAQPPRRKSKKISHLSALGARGHQDDGRCWDEGRTARLRDTAALTKLFAVNPLACHCVCTGCHATMEAVNPKNPNPKHRPHFRHDKAPILEDCARQAILKATIKTLMEATEIELPELRIKGKAVAQDGLDFEAEVTEQQHIVKIQNIETGRYCRCNIDPGRRTANLHAPDRQRQMANRRPEANPTCRIHHRLQR